MEEVGLKLVAGLSMPLAYSSESELWAQLSVVLHMAVGLVSSPPEPGQDAPRGPRVLTTERARARLLAAERFEPTIYLYDSQPGGVGLTERLFELVAPLLARARETLRACACRAGCPSCVGPVNEVGRRAKPMAVTLLDHLGG